jgi:hypothetical protein
MKQNVLVCAVVILAIAGTLWFRRKPMNFRQRVLAVGIAIVMLAVSVLARQGEITLGRIGMVAAGAAILIAAAWHVRRSGGSQDDSNNRF